MEQGTYLYTLMLSFCHAAVERSKGFRGHPESENAFCKNSAVLQLYQLQNEGDNKELIDSLLKSSLAGLKYYKRGGHLDLPAGSRLAFRELGLSIGLHAVKRIDSKAYTSLKDLKGYASLADRIEDFWLNPTHQGTVRWREHIDINEVMLATSLDPEGFLK
jgi:hypothetical protein